VVLRGSLNTVGSGYVHGLGTRLKCASKRSVRLTVAVRSAHCKSVTDTVSRATHLLSPLPAHTLATSQYSVRVVIHQVVHSPDSRLFHLWFYGVVLIIGQAFGMCLLLQKIVNY
jgi:hypothetical protein